jgi:hypothetical protein
MSWPNKPTAEELIGMKAEDLKTRLDSAATKEDITSIKTEIEQSFSNSLNTLREELRAARSEPITNVNPDTSDPTTQVLVDPTGFVADQTKDLRKMSMETQAQVMEMRARQGSYANVFQQYGDDLVKKAYSFPVEQRAMSGFWDTFIRTFLGDQVVKGELKSQYPSLIGSGSVGPNPSGQSPDPNGNFSSDIAGYLKDRHIPMDKAAKLQRLFNDGEPITLANYGGGGNA